MSALLGMLLCLTVSDASAQLERAAHDATLARAGFVENAGRWSRTVRYRAQIGPMTAWLTNEGATLDISADRRSGHVLRHEFIGARARSSTADAVMPATWTAIDASGTYVSRAFGSVTYSALYPGIDARYGIDGGALKYDVIVSPHADASRIRMRYAGAHGVAVAADGSLRIATSIGELREHPPFCYQIVDGRRVVVPASFTIDGGTIGFDIASYDRSRELIIDPSLAFSSYLGGAAADEGRGVALDASFNVYVGGVTLSQDFPTTVGAYNRTIDRAGSVDVFVVKFDPTGSIALYGTFIGGGDLDELAALKVHTDGTVTIAGTTRSGDYPTTSGAFQTTRRGPSDGFITTLSSNGASLLASTYFGGSGEDRIEDLALNPGREAFVVGTTRSIDLPTTPGAFRTSAPGGGDAFVARLDSALDARDYVTYLGGTDNDHATGIALGRGGAANVTGWTSSVDFPTTAGAAQPTFAGATDGFIARVRFTGAVLEYGTYLGGSSHDRPSDIAIDPQGNQYITGLTFSTDLTVTTGDPPGTWFAARVDSSTGAIASGVGYCRYIGPAQNGSARTIQASASGEAFIAGSTDALSFPTTPDKLVAGTLGGFDIGLVRLSSDGTNIVHASVIGGERDELVWHESHLTRFGDLYITGSTVSARFPTTTNAFDTTLGNGGASTDAFVLAYRFSQRPTIQAPVRVTFDTVGCDTSARDTFFIANTGESDLIIRAVRFAGAGGTFVLEEPSAQQNDIVIAPGERRRYIIRYRALATGTSRDTLLVFSNDTLRSSPALKIALSATRTSSFFPGIPTSPIGFGSIASCAGASVDRQITLSNGGNAVANVVSGRMADGSAFRVVQPSRFPFAVAPRADAVFLVRFAPARAGLYRDTLVVSIDGCATPLRVAVVGTADSIAFDVVEDAVTFASGASCTEPLDTFITVRNLGGAITLNAIDPGSGFVVVAPMPMQLAAGETRRVPVRFAPPAGPASARSVLHLASTVCDRRDSVVLTATRGSSAALLAPDSIDFGIRPLCSTDDRDSIVIVELTNTSSTPVDVALPRIAGAFAVENQSEFPAAIAPGGTLSVRVGYHPPSERVSLDTLLVPVDASGCRDTLRVAVRGHAIRPVLAPSDTSITVPVLAACVASDTVELTLRNISAIPIAIDSIATTSGVELLSPALAFIVAPMGSADLVIRFAPRTSGSALERVTLYTRDCRDSIVIDLVGRKEGAVVVAEPGAVSFGDIYSCALDSVRTASVVVRNTGSVPVRIRRAGVSGSGTYRLTATHEGVEVDAGAELSFTISYDPAAIGSDRGVLEVVLDPCGDTLRIPLDASVVEAALTVASLDLGQVGVGNAVTDVLTVRNDLDVEVVVESIPSLPPPFTIVGGPSLPLRLQPGESFDLTIAFAPIIAGEQSATSMIASSSPCAFSTTLSVSGTGVGSGDTLDVCMSGREAGISGDVVTLAIATGDRASIGASRFVEYDVAYDRTRLRFVDAAPPPSVQVLATGASGGNLRVRVAGDAPFGPQHVLLRFQLLSGEDASTSARLVGATITGAPLVLAICSDSVLVRISDRCVLTGVSLGRYANRLESARPNPARGVAEMVFQQLEDAHTTLAIYDLQGREIIRALDEHLAGGRYTVRIDLSSLSPGAYAVRIMAGSFLQTRLLSVER